MKTTTLCLLVCLVAISAVAQQSTARLLGTVKDQTGAVIPGEATTELTEVQPNASIDAAKFARPAPAPRPK